MVPVTDPLAIWWQHPVSVERWLGPGESGDERFADAETVTGQYADDEVYRDGQRIAGGMFAFPIAADGAPIAYVPVQSRLTLPALFGSREVRVVKSQVGISGNARTPDHQVVLVN